MYSKESIAALDEEIRLLEYKLKTLKSARKRAMERYYWFRKRVRSIQAKTSGTRQGKKYPLP